MRLPRPPAGATRRRRRIQLLTVPFLLATAGGCGGARPHSESGAPRRVVEPLRDGGGPGATRRSEPEKIAALIDAVRHSDAKFVRNGRAHPGDEAASHLELKLGTAGDRIRTARDFIDQLATGSSTTGKPYEIELPGGQTIPASRWFYDRLLELERTDQPTAGPVAAQGPSPATPAPTGPRAPGIEDALAAIEGAKVVFLAPQRKGKPKSYGGAQFAGMLRSKWRWIGRDIHELPAFLDEIASESFATLTPYRVRREDGSEVVLRKWLEAELERRASATDPATLAK